MITATQSRGAQSIGGRPVTEFLLIPFGLVTVDQAISGHDYRFTRRHGQAAVEWFGRQGRKLAIDYEHQTLQRVNVHPEGLAPAAGWIGRLEVRSDGLWAADVEWTEKARRLIASGEYRYFSPAIYWTDAEYTGVQSLGPVGLTNDPAIPGVQPLLAARAQRRRDVTAFATVCSARRLPLVGGKGDDLKFQQLLDLLGLSAEAPLEDVKGEITLLMAPETETAASRAALIVAARRSFLKESADPHKVVICSEQAWVNTALRDAELVRLTDGELARLGIAELSNPAPVSAAARGRPVTPTRTGNRASIIVAARGAFAAECANPRKRMITAQRNWVNQALRDAGRPRLTDAELVTHDIAE